MFGLPVTGALSCFFSIPCLMDHPHTGRCGELIIQMHILMPYIQKSPALYSTCPVYIVVCPCALQSPRNLYYAE